jgi:hypothetical protein
MQAISLMTDIDKEKFKTHMSQSRVVKFVLDADPIYIVFYENTYTNDINSANTALLRHEYILKEKNGFKLVNLYKRNVWDEFFDSDIFQKKLFEIFQKKIKTKK